MSCYICILLIVVVIIIIIFLYKYNKNNFFESFNNYTQIPNSKPLVGREIKKYLPIDYNISKNFHFPNLEMTNNQMNSILNKIVDKSKIKKYENLKFEEVKEFKYDYYSGFSGVKIDYSKINEYLSLVMNRINDTIINDNKLSRSKDNEIPGINKKGMSELINGDYLYFLFLLVDYQLIKYSKYLELTKIELLFDIYRFGKSSAFQNYLQLIIENNEMNIIKLHVSGNINEDNLKILSFKDEMNVEFYKNFPYYSPNSDNQNGYILKSTEQQKKVTSIRDQINYLIKRTNKERNIVYDLSYKCFGSQGDNIYQCMSNKDIIGNRKKKGIWDRPCLFDKECPFFKANKNTNNNLGGCVNGICQMPLGVSNVGYHFYSNLDKALCYNCIDRKYCCLDQLNRKKYSKLSSPDYAFSNDKRLFDL